MTSSMPRLPVFAFAALLALLIGGCGRGRKDERPEIWALGFSLPIDVAFSATGGLRPNGEGSLFFLCGDEPDKPRLVVRKRALRLSLDEALEEELVLGLGPEVLERGDPFPVRAVNASGVGVRQTVRPFPERDSTLVLLFDTRVFAVGNFCYAFVWQQPPGDEAGLKRYEEWLTHLTFFTSSDPAEQEPAAKTGKADGGVREP